MLTAFPGEIYSNENTTKESTTNRTAITISRRITNRIRPPRPLTRLAQAIRLAPSQPTQTVPPFLYRHRYGRSCERFLGKVHSHHLYWALISSGHGPAPLTNSFPVNAGQMNLLEAAYAQTPLLIPIIGRSVASLLSSWM
jgi:hypothetical protein